MEIPLGSPSTPLWYHNASSMQSLSGMPLGRDYGTSPMTDHSHAIAMMQNSHPGQSHGHHHAHLHPPQPHVSRSLDSDRKSEPLALQSRPEPFHSVMRDTILESSQEVPIKNPTALNEDYPPPLSLEAPRGPVKIWAQSDQADPPRRTSGADLSLKKSSSLTSSSGFTNLKQLSSSQEKKGIDITPSPSKVESPLKSSFKESMLASQEFMPRSPARQIPMVNAMGQPLSESGSVPKRKPSVPLKSTVKINPDMAEETSNDSNETVFQIDV